MYGPVFLKGCKAVNIKDVIFGRLVGKISVFDCGKSYDLGSIFASLSLHCDSPRSCDTFLINVCDQVLQTHNTAFSCLKRFTVFSIHGTETKEGKLGLRIYKTGFSCAAEYLDKGELLTFVYNIKDLIRLERVSYALR